LDRGVKKMNNRQVLAAWNRLTSIANTVGLPEGPDLDLDVDMGYVHDEL